MNDIKIKSINISDINLDNVYLHYTNLDNLDNITKKGLEPRIGMNSKIVEKNKKIFFSMGDKGALTIMDVWLKWLIGKPKWNLIYWIGAYLLKIKFFPKIIHEVIISNNEKSKNKCNWAYRKLKSILDSSMYLVLNLEENLDFSFNDIDEVKKLSNYPINIIKDMYAYDSDILNDKMEYWNMHTFVNKKIETEKILVLKHNDSLKASEIVKYLIEQNIKYVKKNCKRLYEYYIYTKN
ncbi:MAG: hypothetical protein RR290_04235 [Clostridia bacterium]